MSLQYVHPIVTTELGPGAAMNRCPERSGVNNRNCCPEGLETGSRGPRCLQGPSEAKGGSVPRPFLSSWWSADSLWRSWQMHHPDLCLHPHQTVSSVSGPKSPLLSGSALMALSPLDNVRRPHSRIRSPSEVPGLRTLIYLFLGGGWEGHNPTYSPHHCLAAK